MRAKPFNPLLPFLLSALSLSLSAQPERSEELAFDRPEAWAMQYFMSASLMQGNGPPIGLQKGQFALGFEIGNIPHLSKEERTVGFNGTKEEDLNKAPLVARPLIHFGFTDRLSITASYVPPFEIFDGLKTHLVGASINYLLLDKPRWKLQLRGVGQWSEAKGDFTAPEEVVGIMDPEINPFFAIEPSRDTYLSETLTLDATLFYKIYENREVYAFLNAAYTYGDFEFDVFVPQPDDRTHTNFLYTDGYVWHYSAGVDLRITERLSMRLGGYYTPIDVRRPPDYDVEDDSFWNVRLMMNYQL